jgi:hypothetical protein
MGQCVLIFWRHYIYLKHRKVYAQLHNISSQTTWTISNTNDTAKTMAPITCLYFYDMAVSPVEHHTNVTTLAATQETTKITTTQNTQRHATTTWTWNHRFVFSSKHYYLFTFFRVLCNTSASDGLNLQPAILQFIWIKINREDIHDTKQHTDGYNWCGGKPPCILNVGSN